MCNLISHHLHLDPATPMIAVNPDFRRNEPTLAHGLLDPDQHIIASAAFMIAKIVVEADDFDLSTFKQFYGLVRSEHPHPSKRRLATIIEENTHGSSFR
nr:hypothetical protein [Ruegeria sp. HKCCA4812]